MAQFDDALEALWDAPALILDVRENIGGDSKVTEKLRLSVIISIGAKMVSSADSVECEHSTIMSNFLKSDSVVELSLSFNKKLKE